MNKYLAIILLIISNDAFSDVKSEIEKSLEKDKIQVSICKTQIKNKSKHIITECSNALKMVIDSSLSITQIKEDYNKPYIKNDLNTNLEQRIRNTILLHENMKEELYSALQNLSEDTILKITEQAKTGI